MIRVGSRIAVLAVAAVIFAAPAAYAGPRVAVSVGINVPVVPAAPVAPAVVAAAPIPYPVAPAPYGYVWRPAYSVWTGYGYQVVPAGWARPPYPHAVWVAPHWARRAHGAYWAQGYWRH